jgi:glutathione S-transferase
MITLYQPPPMWGSPSMSPFCIKLEVLLKMGNVAYEAKPADMRKAPKGKIPFVVLEDGTLLGDSQLILQHLRETNALLRDAHLREQERATGHAVRRMIEEATYFAGLHVRWLRDANWPLTQAAFKKILPAPVALFLPLIRGSVRKSVRAQGTGRHDEKTIDQLACADWSSVAALLGDRTFVLGETISTIDATVFAFLESTLCFPIESPIAAHIKKQPNLVAYHARMKSKFFPAS